MPNYQLPNFSALLPVYYGDQVNDFEEALISIKENTVLPTELIIVTDGPVSFSINDLLVKHFTNSTLEISVVGTQTNQGLAQALNLGLKYCQFEIVARVDADDINDKCRFEHQLEYLVDHQLDIASGYVQEFTVTNNKINKLGIRSVPLTAGAIKKFAQLRSPFNHPAVMYRKSKILGLGGYKNYQNLEDFDLWTRALDADLAVGNLAEILVYMRTDHNLYQRRGGFKYFKTYFGLRYDHLKNQQITYQAFFKSTCAMFISSCLLSEKIRKVVYGKVLRK